MAPPLNCNCNNNSIVAILCNQRVTGSFCDTILKVNDKVFFAHSCILAAASSFFQRFFIDSFPRRFSQASPQVVEIQTLHDKSCEMYEKAVLITLDYMYTGKVNCNDKFFDELFEIARMLELDELIQICSKLSNGNLSNKRTSHANILSKKKNKSFLKQNKAERLVSVATQVSCDVDEDFVKNSEDITSVVKFNDVSKLSALDGNYAFTVNSTSSNDSKYSPINMNFEAYNNDSNESLNPHSADQQLPLNKLVSNNSKYCDNLFQSESDILQQPTSKISVPDFHNESSNTNNHPLHLYVDDSLNSTEPIEMRISHNKDEKSLIGASKNSRYIKKASSNNNSASQPTVDKYQCDSCCYSTNSVRMMSRHCKLHKIEQKVCFYCDSQFSSEDALTDHMVSHKGSEPFVCLHCNACFKSRTYLDIHMAKHSCERPFICHVCSMAFKWKHALKNHLIVHNNHKEYLCDNCGYTTAHRSQLKAHCLLHTGDTYKCNYPGCMFQSTKKQNMKYHQLTHTHEKVHQCDICGQSFSLLKNLRRHSLLHNSIRQHRFVCC